jgi:hypothetical protein
LRTLRDMILSFIPSKFLATPTGIEPVLPG